MRAVLVPHSDDPGRPEGRTSRATRTPSSHRLADLLAVVDGWNG